MGRKKVTSSDVAAASGVSQATVSMILNRRENVSFSRETVEKVEAAAKELGYQIPRRKMRRESNGNKLIVVFCPTLTNPYYVMLLHGIEEVAKEKNYGVFVCNTQRDLKIEENYLRMMKSVCARAELSTPAIRAEAARKKWRSWPRRFRLSSSTTEKSCWKLMRSS